MSHVSRRQFLQGAALGVAAGPLLVHSSLQAAPSTAASEKINLAVIGLGNQGGANLNAVSDKKHTQINLVALCDVDDRTAGKAYVDHPGAKKFVDFRKMFDEMEKTIEGVVISTPDHTHFHPAWWALNRGKHVYLEKPLAHTVWEIRQLTDLAAQKKLATQLGAQRHAGKLRDGVEIVKAGVIGEIREVHSWVGSSRGMYGDLVPGGEAPKELNWDLWLGPVASRPYQVMTEEVAKGKGKNLVPYNWRFYWEFGTGESGNWGCHILDIPYWALNLRYPTKVYGAGPSPDPIKTPKEMATRLEFPRTSTSPGVTLHWYQGPPKLPESLNVSDKQLKGFNNLFVGSQGTLLTGFDGYKLLPEDKFKEYKVTPTFPKSPGFHVEWFNAIRGEAPATCNWEYSGPMAETVLLANIAYRIQGGFDWDAQQLKASGNSAVERMALELL